MPVGNRIRESVTPTEREAQLAEESSRALSVYAQKTGRQTIKVVPGRGARTRRLPSLLQHFAFSSISWSRWRKATPLR